MKAAGITAEYNPLHNGHVFHISETRRVSGCDAVCIAMSGDYVQRGEPALTDKWTRTRMALECGADLVIEIPVLFCLGDASRYASAGVRLLEEAGCADISFGSERGDSNILLKEAAFIRENRKEIGEYIAQKADKGLSYPAAREEACRKLLAERDPEASADLFSTADCPNDILAVEYMLSMSRSNPLIIKRQGAGVNDGPDPDKQFQSASAIREMLADGSDISPFVPHCVSEMLQSEGLPLTFRDEWFGLLRYAVISNSAERIDDCPSGGEGLGNLFKKEILCADSWDGFIQAVKSKRYTYTRISRLCMQIILGITRSGYPQESPGYMRVLGFNDKGRELLAQIKKKGSGIPVITNINKEAHRLDSAAASMLELDVRAADIYNSASGRSCASDSDHIKGPVMITDKEKGSETI